jgi:predicted RNA-binding protein associated with RNAse of E/G family
MIALVAALALALSPAPAQPGGAPTPTAHIARIMAHGDGRSPQTAYKVGSVREEYEIVRALGFTVKSQALVGGKKPYDMLEVVDARGNVLRLWFDISAFYPEF